MAIEQSSLLKRNPQAVIYARVSSKEQEKEGFSIPAQIKLLKRLRSKNRIKSSKNFKMWRQLSSPGGSGSAK
jgi:predicted site-specific integrase-resolvase